VRTHSEEAMRTCGHLRTLNPYIGMCVFVRPCALAPRVRDNQVTLRLGASKARLAYQVQQYPHKLTGFTLWLVRSTNHCNKGTKRV